MRLRGLDRGTKPAHGSHDLLLENVLTVARTLPGLRRSIDLVSSATVTGRGILRHQKHERLVCDGCVRVDDLAPADRLSSRAGTAPRGVIRPTATGAGA